MACGAPVVTSAHSSMDEASGGAAVRTDPESAEAVARAVDEALADVETLVALGCEHARRFTSRAQGAAVLSGYLAVRRTIRPWRPRTTSALHNR
jgi:glycosyltransferase involved in cell wall biosynthesis